MGRRFFVVPTLNDGIVVHVIFSLLASLPCSPPVFCHPGFEPPLNELEFLRKRLQEQQAMTEMANKARLEAEARAAVAERECEIYRLLSQRYKNRLDETTGVRGEGDEEYTEHLVAGLLIEARDGPAIGVGNLFRQFRNRLRAANRGDDDDSDDDEDEDEDEDEDSDGDDSEMEEDLQDEEEAVEDQQAASDEDGDVDMEVSVSDPRAFKARSKQPRTVSMSEDDL